MMKYRARMATLCYANYTDTGGMSGWAIFNEKEELP